MAKRNGNSYASIDKDPMLALIKYEAERVGGGKISHAFLEQLSHDSGISVSTFYSWFQKKDGTKRPQHLTVKFALMALGCSMKVLRDDGTEVRGPHI